jgi:hypothetical protein
MKHRKGPELSNNALKLTAPWLAPRVAVGRRSLARCWMDLGGEP